MCSAFTNSTNPSMELHQHIHFALSNLKHLCGLPLILLHASVGDNLTIFSILSLVNRTFLFLFVIFCNYYSFSQPNFVIHLETLTFLCHCWSPIRVMVLYATAPLFSSRLEWTQLRWYSSEFKKLSSHVKSRSKYFVFLFFSSLMDCPLVPTQL